MYKVEFECYQYNSGRADNGIYTYSREFETEESAREFIKKMHDDESFSNKVANEVMGYDGYFLKVSKLTKVTEEELDVGIEWWEWKS